MVHQIQIVIKEGEAYNIVGHQIFLTSYFKHLPVQGYQIFPDTNSYYWSTTVVH